MAWSSIEPSVAIISACLPTFAPLFRMGGGNTRREVGSGYDDVRTPGPPPQYGVHRATASRAVWKNEDEVELTGGMKGRDRYSGPNPPPGHGATNAGSIVVDTEVRVSTETGRL